MRLSEIAGEAVEIRSYTNFYVILTPTEAGGLRLAERLPVMARGYSKNLKRWYLTVRRI